MRQPPANFRVWPKIRRPFWRSALRAIPASAIIGTLTFICFAFRFDFPTVSFCFLIIVVLQSLTGDFLSSVFASVIAFLSLNYFFVPPIFSLRVSDPSDTLALISFLIAGLVITRLTSRAREAAELEKLHRAEATKLYSLARQLLTLEPGLAAEADLLKSLKSEFDLQAACLFDASSADTLLEGTSHELLVEKTREAYIARNEFQDSASSVAIKLLRSGPEVIGAIGFEGLRDFESRAGPLSALAALMIERTRIFRGSTRAVAAAEAEVFRGAMLDALAHEFKTPLATITAAAGGLAESGSLRPEQLELVRAMESEASRLAQLTGRLLRLAQLDREEVKPNLELTDLNAIVRSLLEQYSRRWSDRQIVIREANNVRVLGDQELLRLAIAQLLDNACKYSGAKAKIVVSVQTEGSFASVSVWNSGTSVPQAEQKRIFDRFYRGSNAAIVAPGSGLGLYITRKIALAHAGTLDMDCSAESDGGTVFRLTIPKASNELENDHAKIQCTNR